MSDLSENKNNQLGGVENQELINETSQEEILIPKRNIEDLLKEHMQFESILDSMNEATIILDHLGSFIYANKSAIAFMGFTSKEELLKTPFSEILTRVDILDDDGQILSVEKFPSQQALHGEITTRRVIHARTKVTNEEHWIEITSTPHLKDDGTINFSINIFHDITKRKRAEQIRMLLGEISKTLAASLDYQTTLSNVARLVVPHFATWCTVDLLAGDGSLQRLAVAHVDPQKIEWAYDLLRRYPPNPQAKSGVFNVMRTGQAEFFFDIPAEIRKVGLLSAEEIAISEEIGLISVITVPLKVHERTIGAINFVSSESGRHYTPDDVVIAEEIARRAALAIDNARLYSEMSQERASLTRRVEERTSDLSAANAELAKTVHLKDEFLASMSHELRTPLNAINGLSEALLELVYGPLNEKQISSVQMVKESGEHLLSLINDILDLSKIGAGKFEMEISDVPVQDVCQASLRLIGQFAQKKYLRLRSSYDNQINCVRADPRRLKQILVNLLNNAIKFTPEGGTIGLEVEGDSAEQTVRFTVWDTGIGIPQESIGRLFQPFVQLDSSLSRQQTGTGLGLALVYHMVDMQGGSVSVESEPNKGSRFTVSLPWHEQTGAYKPLSEKPSPSRPTGLTINCALIVEDSSVSAAQLMRYLEELSIEPILHNYDEDIVAAVSNMQPDIIILDILLPHPFSGWDMLSQLKVELRTKEIPVVIVSVVDARSEGLLHGASGYLLKPFTRQELLETLYTASSQRPAPTLAGNPSTTRETKAIMAQPLILLAEDNETNIKLFQDYLMAHHYNVTVARNGEEALVQAAEEHPQLILMDIQMPKMDGWQAIEHLRANPHLKDIPVIALTALAMPGDRERSFKAGVADYLTKPVNLQHLLRTIEQHLK